MIMTEDMLRARLEFLRGYLNGLHRLSRDASAVRASGGVYDGPEEFVLWHGVSYTPAPLPEDLERLAPRSCYGNAILWAARRPDLRYVEGYALPAVPAQVPVHHAWLAGPGGTALEVTWKEPGTAYLGVEFSVERADDCTWNGDANVLDDWHRRWPLLRERWTGEDWQKVWPPSKRLELARLVKIPRRSSPPATKE